MGKSFWLDDGKRSAFADRSSALVDSDFYMWRIVSKRLSIIALG